MIVFAARTMSIATLLIYGVTEGHPHADRRQRSEAADDVEAAVGDANMVDDDQQLPEGKAPSDSSNDGNNDDEHVQMHGKGGISHGGMPSDDGLLPSMPNLLGNKGQGGSSSSGGLASWLTKLPSFGSGAGGGMMGPMAVLGGFSALVMPMGGMMNNLPGAMSSLMGLMSNLGSLPSIPAIGGGSSG